MTPTTRWARVVQQLANAEYRIHDRLRPRDSFAALEAPTLTESLSGLTGKHTCLLVTYRPTGEPVPSPVYFGVADGKVYFRAEARTAKLRRIATNSTVLIAPCSFRGRPLGAFLKGTAKLLDTAEEPAAYAALRANYRWLDRLYESTADHLPIQPAYVEITCVIKQEIAPDVSERSTRNYGKRHTRRL